VDNDKVDERGERLLDRHGHLIVDHDLDEIAGELCGGDDEALCSLQGQRAAGKARQAQSDRL
jgi:hypothetical protein